MFSNIGWTEMLVIAVIAVIFVGPKDLPGMLRQFGRFSRKVRGMAGDFQKQVDDALREAELDSVRDSINDVRKLDPRKAVRDQLNPFKDEIERDPNAGDPGAPVPEKEPLVFDDAAAPAVTEPVKVDVEAALARHETAEAEAAKPAPTKKPAPAKKPTAKKSAPAKKTVAGKSAAAKAKSPARSRAAPKKTGAEA